MPDDAPLHFYRVSDKTLIGLRPANIDKPEGETLAEGTRYTEKQDACGRIAIAVPTKTYPSLAEARRMLTRTHMPCSQEQYDHMRRSFQLLGTAAGKVAGTAAGRASIPV